MRHGWLILIVSGVSTGAHLLLPQSPIAKSLEYLGLAFFVSGFGFVMLEIFKGRISRVILAANVFLIIITFFLLMLLGIAPISHTIRLPYDRFTCGEGIEFHIVSTGCGDVLLLQSVTKGDLPLNKWCKFDGPLQTTNAEGVVLQIAGSPPSRGFFQLSIEGKPIEVPNMRTASAFPSFQALESGSFYIPIPTTNILRDLTFTFRDEYLKELSLSVSLQIRSNRLWWIVVTLLSGIAAMGIILSRVQLLSFWRHRNV